MDTVNHLGRTPRVLSEDVPRQEVLDAMEEPDIEKLSVIAFDTILRLTARFRRALKALCRDRGLPVAIPSRLMVASTKAKGVLLLWPGAEDDPDGFPIHKSPQERRVTVDLPEAFERLKVALPYGVVIEVPAVRYHSPRFGHCLALHFKKAEFLYKKSKTAVTLQPE